VPCQTAFWIFPAFRQDVHTLTRLTEPFTTARTSCRFGSHRRGDRLFAWLTLFPAIGFLPHISHAFAIISRNSFHSQTDVLIKVRIFPILCNTFFRIVFCRPLIQLRITFSSPCYSTSFSIFLTRATATFPHFQRSKEDIARFPSTVLNEN